MKNVAHSDAISLTCWTKTNVVQWEGVTLRLNVACVARHDATRHDITKCRVRERKVADPSNETKSSTTRIDAAMTVSASKSATSRVKSLELV